MMLWSNYNSPRREKSGGCWILDGRCGVRNANYYYYPYYSHTITIVVYSHAQIQAHINHAHNMKFNPPESPLIIRSLYTHTHRTPGTFTDHIYSQVNACALHTQWFSNPKTARTRDRKTVLCIKFMNNWPRR